MSNNRQPPLYGRPPYATDEDDAVYDQVQQPQARPRQRQPEQPPNGGRDSMYQAWDNYLHTDKDRPNSGVGGIGMGLMAGDMDDSDDEDAPAQRNNQKSTAPLKSSNLRPSPAQEQPKRSFEGQRQPPQQQMNMNNGRQPIARPPPAAGGAVPPSAARNPFARPPAGPQHQQQQPPMAHPVPRQVQRPAAAALRVDVPHPAMPIPRAPIPAFMPSPSPSPSLNPHPLNAPSTPITPVFARPSFQQDSEPKVQFADGAIMRGMSEETLLPRNTQKGEEFWRRFSYYAKEDPKAAKSSWLKSTMGSSRSMSRWVWCIAIFLLIAIGGGIGFGWWATHSAPATVPVVVDGSANESQLSTAAAATTAAPAAAGTSRTLIPVTAATRRDLGDYAYFEERRSEQPTQPAVAPGSRLRKRDRLNRLAMDALD